MKKKFVPASTLLLAAIPGLLTKTASAKPHSIKVETISSMISAAYNNQTIPPPGAALIVVHEPLSQRLLVVNQAAMRVNVFNISTPAFPSEEFFIDMSIYGGMPTSVAVKDGLLAVALTGSVGITAPGSVIFFQMASAGNSAVTHLATIPVGSLPDMITFTPNGRYLLSANEGEPSPDYTVDPEGSISIIDIESNFHVTTAGFTAFNSHAAALRSEQGVRLFGPNATVAQDLEPEWITVSHDSKTAWVTLQENNAMAIIDIPTRSVRAINGLGTKNHALPGNEFDASDKDGRINITNWPVEGLYQADAVEVYRVQGQDFLVMANEGSARDTPASVNEEARVFDLILDPIKFPSPQASELKKLANLGRLRVSKTTGDTNGDGTIDVLQSFGGRSFTIRTGSGDLVWDSGSQFENIIAQLYPANFNTGNTTNAFDDRSDDKGPEPEGVALGKAFGRQYAFIALERIGGFFVYDISDPRMPEYVDYVNNRNFGVAPALKAAGDLGAEGITFINAENSPNGVPLIVVANEISGTTTIFQISKL